jgi:AraC-like DNA-binding protein
MPNARPGRFQESTAGVRLLAGTERVGLCGHFPSVSRHQHAAPSLVIGIDGPIRLVADRTHESRAALIVPGFSHAVDLRGGRLAMFVLPPHARSGEGVSPVRDLRRPRDWVALGEAVYRGELSDFGEVDALLARERFQDHPIDDRLKTALDVLAQNLDDNVSIDFIGSAARLSPSRLMGLAHSQLSTSFRHYRRWLRAFRVARDYAAGASLTEAAIAAGFSSSAHLSATARAHFGIRPSDILIAQNRSQIRVI